MSSCWTHFTYSSNITCIVSHILDFKGLSGASFSMLMTFSAARTTLMFIVTYNILPNKGKDGDDGICKLPLRPNLSTVHLCTLKLFKNLMFYCHLPLRSPCPYMGQPDSSPGYVSPCWTLWFVHMCNKFPNKLQLRFKTFLVIRQFRRNFCPLCWSIRSCHTSFCHSFYIYNVKIP